MRRSNKQHAINKRAFLALLVGLFAMTSTSTVYAQESESVDVNGDATYTEDEIVDALNQQMQEETDRLAQAQAREERKRAAREKKEMMESCLTLVRAYYAANEEWVKAFMEEHPTMDKSRLLSKILAQMMITCNASINEDQIHLLQGYKHTALSFSNWSKPEYASLIEMDWENLRYVPADGEESAEADPNAGRGPVEMTPEEILISSEVEDYSDAMKNEMEEEMRGEMGKT